MKDTQAPRTGPRRTNNSKLARLRIERSLTQQQLADAIGCSKITVVRWEAEQGIPNIRIVKNAAALFGCSMEDLV